MNTVSGTVTLSGGPTAASAIQLQGNSAVAAATSGNPVRTGCTAYTATPSTLAANGQTAAVLCSSTGAQVVAPFVSPELYWQSVTDLTTTSDVSLRTAGSGSLRNYVASAQIVNTGAADALVNLKDGTTIYGRFSIKPGETRDIVFAVPLRGTATTAVQGACVATCTATVNLQGFVAP